jgi:hypothetical protein
MTKELIAIWSKDITLKQQISEAVAHEIIANKWRVLMIFERPDKTLYWYEATEFTDLWHAKKQTINELVWFYNI